MDVPCAEWEWSPLVQVKESYGNLDMVTCRLSSCNPECKKYIPAYNAREGVRQYVEKENKVKQDTLFLYLKTKNKNRIKINAVYIANL